MPLGPLSEPVSSEEYYISAGMQNNGVAFTASLINMGGNLDQAAQEILDVMVSRPDIFSDPNVQKSYRAQAFFQPTPPPEPPVEA